jgi:hypothetical protein
VLRIYFYSPVTKAVSADIHASPTKEQERPALPSTRPQEGLILTARASVTPRFQLVLQAQPSHLPVETRLKAALKRLGRDYKLRCLSCKPLP